MKTSKRILSILVVLLLCLSFSGSAFASGLSKFRDTQRTTGQATYASTQSFLDAMDAEEIRYTYHGLDSDKDDWVEVIYSGDYCDEIDIDIYFSSAADRASFRFWKVIEFDEADYANILFAVNQLNYDYKWVKFVADSSDNSVSAEIDVLFPSDDAGAICLESLDQIVNIADLGYSELKAYMK